MEKIGDVENGLNFDQRNLWLRAAGARTRSIRTFLGELQMLPNNKTRLNLFVVLMIVAIAGTAAGQTIYVDASATGTPDGSSWTHAYLSLQDALTAVAGGGTILVAEGTYTPDQGGGQTPGDRYATFQLISGVAIYGGFPSGGCAWEDRDPIAYETILSGDLNGDDVEVTDPQQLKTEPTRGENSYQVVSMISISDAILDGFTITGGNANSNGGGMYCYDADSTNILTNCTISTNSARTGGGMYCERSSPSVTNCRIYNNSAVYGGGVSCVAFGNPVITNCTISGNVATNGGGMHNNYYCSPIITDCQISGNSATRNGGGVFCYQRTSAAMTNCTISENSAVGSGGAIYYYYFNPDSIHRPLPSITNCTITDNSASKGGGVYCEEHSYPRITNTIFEGNTNHAIYEHDPHADAMVTYCLFFNNEDGDFWDEGNKTYTGANNINMNIAGASDNVSGDPLFVNKSDGDFHLQDDSAALDRGTAVDAPSTDFEGDTRPGSDDLVDIGVDEADSLTPAADTKAPVSYVEDVPLKELNLLHWGVEKVPIIRMEGIPKVVYKTLFDVPYVASDAESGVQHVELFYSREAGAWTQYGANFTTSPISFDSSSTGGDGLYEFYTIATDNAGNKEVAPPLGNCEISVISGSTGSVIFVDKYASGEQTGVDWTNALNEIQVALDVAAGNDITEVWVAAGTYNEWITLRSNVSLYGGFNRVDTIFSSRDVVANPTIIDASTADEGGPANHVVVVDDVTNTTINGFTITGGNADDPGYDNGGGIYCYYADNTNNIANCTISGNLAEGSGGGVFSRHFCSPVITNCTISFNQTDGDGAGVSSYRFSYPVIVNCTINANAARHGGGVWSRYYSSPIITNCQISGNSATGSGGGIYSYNISSPSIHNCTFSGNLATYGGGVYCYVGHYGPPEITNTIFEGNKGHAIYETNTASDIMVNYCLFHNNPDGDYYDEGTTSYTGAEAINTNVADASNNLDGDPMFVEPGYWDESTWTWVNGDYHLLSGSPCIDSGDNASLPQDIVDLDDDGDTTEPLPWDLDGNPRIIGDAVDMGAYEVTVTQVAIDIKPGSYPNAINLGSHGLIPVGILSSEDFDATTVDPETVELAGAGVAVRGKSNKYMAHQEDLNGDGLLDLMVQVATENLDPDSFQDGFAILTGNLLEEFGGTLIEGTDEITIVPPSQ